MGSPAELTLRWVDDTTGQEVVATPRMQALAEAIENEITKILTKVLNEPEVLEAIFHLYTEVLMNTIPVLAKILGLDWEGLIFFSVFWFNLLLDLGDNKTTWESFNGVAHEELNFPLMSEQNQVQVTLDRVLSVLRAVANELTGYEQTEEIEDMKKDSDM